MDLAKGGHGVHPNRFNKFPYGNQTLLRGALIEWLLASTGFSASSHTQEPYCCTAPLGGTCPDPTPGAEGTAPRKRGEETKEFALSTLFAILNASGPHVCAARSRDRTHASGTVRGSSFHSVSVKSIPNSFLPRPPQSVETLALLLGSREVRKCFAVSHCKTLGGRPSFEL